MLKELPPGFPGVARPLKEPAAPRFFSWLSETSGTAAEWAGCFASRQAACSTTGTPRSMSGCMPSRKAVFWRAAPMELKSAALPLDSALYGAVPAALSSGKSHVNTKIAFFGAGGLLSLPAGHPQIGQPQWKDSMGEWCSGNQAVVHRPVIEAFAAYNHLEYRRRLNLTLNERL